MNQLYTHTHILFQILFQNRVLQEIKFPVLYSKSLLFTYFIYSSVCFLFLFNK